MTHKLCGGVCLLALIFAGCAPQNDAQLSVSGQIEAVSVGAGSRVGGRVKEILVREGARVKKDDVMIRLEEDEARAAYDAACARLDQAQAVLDKLEAGARPEEIQIQEAVLAQAEAQYLMAVRGARSEDINSARARCEAAQTRRDQTKADYLRAKNLYESNAISEQKADQAKSAFEIAESEYKATMDQLDLLLHGTRDEQITMAKADVDKARAALDELNNGARKEDLAAAKAARDTAAADKSRMEVTLREMTVVAPQDGVAEKVDIHPGDLVKPGALVRILSPEDLEMIVYVSAKYLGFIRLNQEVPLTTDSYGAETFQGSVSYIAPEGEYTPRNLQTQEERVQQVFAVKLKLDSAGGRLRSGMAATAHFTFSGA